MDRLHQLTFNVRNLKILIDMDIHGKTETMTQASGLIQKYLQPDRHVFNGNNAHKYVTVFHNFGSSSFFIFISFLIATL